MNLAVVFSNSVRRVNTFYYTTKLMARKKRNTYDV